MFGIGCFRIDLEGLVANRPTFPALQVVTIVIEDFLPWTLKTTVWFRSRQGPASPCARPGLSTGNIARTAWTVFAAFPYRSETAASTSKS
ncbi:MAG: hypothetical protein HKN33_11935 [Pyrinomonadaceae bacterium]|nr:hypothetical protein [Pyrinomonadaceae bacterium]